MTDPQPKSANRLRFSLRTGLVFFFLLSGLFAVAAHLHHDILKRCAVNTWLVEHSEPLYSALSWKKGIVCTHAPDGELTQWTRFVRSYVHPEYGRKFDFLTFYGDPMKEQPDLDLSLLFGAKTVHLHDPKMPNTVMLALAARGMTELRIETHSKFTGEVPPSYEKQRPAVDLEKLTWEGGQVPRELGEMIAKSPKLTKLSLTSVAAEAFPPICRVENLEELALGWSGRGAVAPGKLPSEDEHRLLHEGFAELAKRPRLTRLTILGRCAVSPADIREFCETSNVRELTIRWTELAPNALQELARLLHLETLDLNEPHLTDEHLQSLAASKSLKLIRIAPGPKNSAEGILELDRRMSNCEVQRY